jgi:Lrp/AsnC family transcriptional regulator for asnA, asnC and gidA
MSFRVEIDNLDIEIIRELQKDARMHYKKIASKLGVAEGTIRNRVGRMTQSGFLILEARVNPMALKSSIAALVGLKLEKRNQIDIMKKIEKIPGVTSVWSTTGRFDLFFEIMVDSLKELNSILFRKDQGVEKIGGILSSETFVLLESNTKYYKIR